MQKKSVEDIASVLVSKGGLSQEDAMSFVNVLFDTVKRGLERDKVLKIKGFGTFKIIGVEARKSVNVNTGEAVIINGHEKITFTPENMVKDLVNKPFSQFETVILNDGVEFEDMNAGGTQDESAYNADMAEESDTVGTRIQDADENAGEDEVPVFDMPVSQDYFLASENPDVAVEESADEKEPVTDEENDSIEDGDSCSIVTEREDAMVAPSGNEDNTIEEDACEYNEGNAGSEESEHDGLSEDDADSLDVDVESPETEPASEPETDIDEETVDDGDTNGGQQALHDAVEEMPCGDDSIISDGNSDDVYAHEATAAVSKDNGTRKEDDAHIGLWVTLTWIFVTLVLMAVSAFGGYMYRVYEAPGSAKQMEAGLEESSEENKTPEVASLDTVRRDTSYSAVVVSKTVHKDTVAPKQAVAAGKPETAEPDYNSMDVRVRTGAYKIVGLDKVYVVKDGESIETISRRFLGEGMECYIEVYNGLKSGSKLASGQKINIPKLQWKKRRK